MKNKKHARPQLSIVRATPKARAVEPVSKSPARPQDEGGLFEDVDSFPGSMTINGYSSAGQRLFKWVGIDTVWDDDLREALEALLVRLEPTPGKKRPRGHLSIA